MQVVAKRNFCQRTGKRIAKIYMSEREHSLFTENELKGIRVMPANHRIMAGRI
jgi:hypothetical protein